MKSMFEAALFIARKDLAFMLRQRETLLWVFAMPLLFFYFIGTVTGGFAQPRGARPDPLALQASTGDVIVDELVRHLEVQNYEVRRPETAEEFGQYSRRLTVVPPGSYPSAMDAVAAGEQVQVNFTSRGNALAANFDQFRVGRATYTVVADLAVLESEGRPVTADAFRELAAAPRTLTLSVRPAGTREAPPDGFSQAVPGTMVMFTMLVLLTSGAVMLIVEREYGLLARLASAPISRGSIVLGKWMARMTLGLVQLGFAMIVGRLIFRVDWGPTLPMVMLVLAAWASFNASLSLLLGNIARTQAQMIGVGIMATMVLAALGGAWWPIEITPEWMQTLALTLPTGWTMDALHQLVNFGYGPETALPHLTALVASALAAGWAGARIFRYR